MDIFFTDPNEIPLPPEEVRIREFRAEPWADGRKIRIYLEVDPSQKRPSAEVNLLNPQGEPISSIHIVESMTRKMEVNLHLRTPPTDGKYTLIAKLYFDQLHPDSETDQPPQIDHLQTDTAEVSFSFDLAADSQDHSDQ
jgi:hypothetical protein